MASEPFYTDTGPYSPPTNCFPTWDTVMRMYTSRVYIPGMSKGDIESKELAIRHVSQILLDIWRSADGCPKTINAICYQLKTEVLPMYQKYRKGDYQSGENVI